MQERDGHAHTHTHTHTHIYIYMYIYVLTIVESRRSSVLRSPLQVTSSLTAACVCNCMAVVLVPVLELIAKFLNSADREMLGDTLRCWSL